ncbi:hypothetical protein ACOJQI_11085 [Bacillus salacetis]|uniref:hypothetical protein n=1 Tax=Bacillus salacetis TaxID=2315464 RepID=UPI003BA3997E
MGFYYFIILFIGIYFIFAACIQAFKHNSFLNKKGILSLTIGVLFIGLSIFLFSPGSSEIIADLLNLR